VDIIRHSLKEHKLDIPGTAYFDPELEHLSEYYVGKEDTRKYFVLWDGDRVCGGIGFSKFEHYEKCAEMQKLYLADDLKGQGYGKKLLLHAEAAAKEMGFERLYIETHTNLDVAINLYLRYGYREIERPPFVFHSTMDCFMIKDI